MQAAMAVGKKPAVAPVKGKKKSATFVIDCSKPVEDKIMKIGEFEKFLVDKIKVDNKTGMPPLLLPLCMILSPVLSCLVLRFACKPPASPCVVRQ